jgi:hypothetical protein
MSCKSSLLLVPARPLGRVFYLNGRGAGELVKNGGHQEEREGGRQTSVFCDLGTRYGKFTCC